MSALSDSRITVLARAALRVMGSALNETKRILGTFFQSSDAIEAAVRKKIRSLSRKVERGTAEWDVLYRRYLEEETQKRKF